MRGDCSNMTYKNIHGGGANTMKNGLKFEQDTSLEEQLNLLDYLQEDNNVSGEYFFEGKKVAKVTAKHRFYKDFLNPLQIDEMQILSKKLLPDSVLINFVTRRVFIIEKKYQEGVGSVDEKLQTVDFKLKMYKRLLESTDFTPEFYFVLSDWFKQDSYKDVLEYIKEMNCDYFFNEIPLSKVDMDYKTFAHPSSWSFLIKCLI